MKQILNIHVLQILGVNAVGEGFFKVLCLYRSILLRIVFFIISSEAYNSNFTYKLFYKFYN